MCGEFLLHEVFHALSPYQKLQGFNPLASCHGLVHRLLIILVEPETLIFVRDMLKFNCDTAHVGMLEVGLDIADRGASALQLGSDTVVERVLVETVRLV